MIKTNHPEIKKALALLKEKVPDVLTEIEFYVGEIRVPESYNSVEARRYINEPATLNLIFTALVLEPSELAGMIVSEGMRAAYYLKKFGPCDTETLANARDIEIEIEIQSNVDELKVLQQIGAPQERIELISDIIKTSKGYCH